MITKDKVLKDYDIIKARAHKYFKENKYEQCLATIEAAAFLAYNFNFFYTDSILDDLVKKIGKKYSINLPNEKSDEKNVFYDSFGWDNRGLTQQYIRALISTGKPLIYILETDSTLNLGEDIFNELKNYDWVEVIIISDNLTRLEKIIKINEVLKKIEPTRIFTHKNPWNTVGNAVFSNLDNIEIFHINLTDHTFWLGANAADYFLEFRNYGANISIQERNIPKEKVFILPYYPIVNSKSFNGFPIETKNKIKIFTGATFYKMYGDNGKFFHLIKSILNRNNDVVFLIAGSGYDLPIKEFIRSNNFEKRVFLLGDRKDINEVFANIDIYIPTYPYTGGLMVQFAALSLKPIVAYTKENLPFNIVEEIVMTNNHKITYFDDQSFLNEVERLISDKSYYDIVSKKMENTVVSEDTFNKNFLFFLKNKKTIIPIISYNIDINIFADIYLESENKYLNAYNGFLYRYFKSAGLKIEKKYYGNILKFILQISWIKFKVKFSQLSK